MDECILKFTLETIILFSEISRTISEAQQCYPNETANHRYTATKYVERPAPSDLRGKQRHFVDNDNNFTFRNGTVDNAAFANDGLHLSDSGVDRLMSNLGLPPRSSVRNKRQQQNRRPAAPRTPSRDTPNGGTSDHEWCVIERRNRHRHSIGKCANCSETNLVTANCKHHQKVQRRQCGERGHKEKHHTRN